ncbi:hypothetical protein ABZZ36_40445 [Actinacidiphila glaucinigra]|uniref:hypothetical protein n=1 Tax=Actinacidiphila glaucinigra TaxID=235986 RepID=UPI0033A0F7B9
MRSKRAVAKKGAFSTKKMARLTGVALIPALAIAIGAGTSAYAAQPGEESGWHQQFAGGSAVAHRGMDEARDAQGNIVQVWRGATNNNVYISMNNSTPWAWTTNNGTALAQTYAPPQVVWTDYGFRIYHTGTDGHIYYAGIGQDAYGHITALGNWLQVPNNVVTPNDRPPAVAALPGGESVYLAYRGSNSAQIYGVYFNGQGDNRYPGGWHTPVALGSATSNWAPALDFNGSWNRLVMAWTGEDHHIYASSQIYGSSNWGPPVQIGSLQSNESPTMALTDNGAGQIAIVPYALGYSGGTTELASIYRDSTLPSGIHTQAWTGETSGINWGDITLSADDNDIYMNAAQEFNHLDYWKHTGSY